MKFFKIAKQAETEPCSAAIGPSRMVLQPDDLAAPASWMNVCPSQIVNCPGQALSWEYQSLVDEASAFYLSVWRDNGNGTISMVGSTRINATTIGLETYELQDSERFNVQTGDFLGIYYEDLDWHGVVPYANEQKLNGFTLQDLENCRTAPLERNDVQELLRIFGNVRIENFSPVRRLYSFRLNVGGTQSMQKSQKTLWVARGFWCP